MHSRDRDVWFLTYPLETKILKQLLFMQPYFSAAVLQKLKK